MTDPARWDEDSDDDLVRMVSEGIPEHEIAERMNRTPNAIIARCYKLHIARNLEVHHWGNGTQEPKPRDQMPIGFQFENITKQEARKISGKAPASNKVPKPSQSLHQSLYGCAAAMCAERKGT